MNNIHMKKYLMYIAADGKVSEDEIDDLHEITAHPSNVKGTVNRLKIIIEIVGKRSKQCL